jgi:hypothetical protein
VQTDQIGLCLLRADQDLIEKFINPTTQSTSRRCSLCENEIEYFIVTQDMICRVLNEHKIVRKTETTNSPSPVRRKSSSGPSPSPSTHHRFFSPSLFNENTKINT